MSQRAVFLDRDGTINEEMGHMNHLSRFTLFPWAAEAIRLLNGAGYKVIIVTDQSGVARGLFPEALVKQIHQKLQDELARMGAWIDAVYYCPHHPTGAVADFRQDCRCRKPRPGMIEQAQREWDLDLSQSYLVGDRYNDVRLAHAVGAQGILVLTGYGRGEIEHWGATWPTPPNYVAEHLLDAVHWVLNHR
jgi:D-glycero-D-manno-heptose 1,7-bisphosphate phosphatase